MIEITEIPIKDIKVLNRLRKIKEHKVQELTESIKQINLLHPVVVAKKDDYFLLLSGNHRYASFKALNRTTIPAIVKEDDVIINQLVEVSENLISNRLNAIQESNHILLREKLLIKLGKKAEIGTNQHTSEDKLTNQELATQLGISRRIYQYKKQIANIIPEVQEIIEETKFAENMMDMVHLSKQTKEVQMEVAKIINEGQAQTYKRAFILANLKLNQNIWTEDKTKLKDECGIPKSIMEFSRKKDKLNDICSLVSRDEKLKITRKTGLFGTNPIQNYTMLPEHSRWFVKYFSNKGDLIADSFFGKGSNLIASAYEGRKVIGWDLSRDNVDAVNKAILNYTKLKKSDCKLYNTCGVTMHELKEAQNVVDLALTDIPYFQAEVYNPDDSRDLGNIKKIDDFLENIEKYLINIKRLIKPSNYEEKIFKPIIIKCGTKRNGKHGIIDLATEIELLTRKHNLIVHDKIYNKNKSAYASFTLIRSIENKYTVKSHETNIVIVKYE